MDYPSQIGSFPCRLPTAGTLQQMMDTMERLMEDPFAYATNNWTSAPAVGNNAYRRVRTPWAIKETETSYKNVPDDAPLGLTVFDKQLVLYCDVEICHLEAAIREIKKVAINTYLKMSPCGFLAQFSDCACI